MFSFVKVQKSTLLLAKHFFSKYFVCINLVPKALFSGFGKSGKAPWGGGCVCIFLQNEYYQVTVYWSDNWFSN